MAIESWVPSTFGTVATRHLEDDVEFFDVSLPANFSIPPHRHERAQIVVVLEGIYAESVETAPRAERRLAPGSVVLRAPGMLHSNRTGPREARALLLDFGSRRFASLFRAASSRLAVYSFDFVLHEIGREIAAELAREDEAASETIEGFARFLAARFIHLLREPRGKPPPEWFLRALAIAQTESDRGLRVSWLASRVGVHPATLTAAFREHHGTSTAVFLTTLRLRRAARRLAESDLGIDRIALDSGFCDQAHLGRHFKRHYGVTPAAYRRSRRHGGRDSS